MLRRIPSRSSSSKKSSLKSRLSAKKKTRSNGSGMSLREALAARQSSKSRSNPSQGKMTLRQALAARSNGVASRRDELSSEIADLSSQYRDKQRQFAQNPSETNRRLVEYYRNMLENAKDSLKKMSASLRGGSTTRKAATRKKATRKTTARKTTARKTTAKKSTAKKAKSGVANTTAAYKSLRSTGSKTKFSRAFNAAFKKAKRSGKNVASAQRSAIAAGKKAVSARKNPSSAVKRSLSALAANAKTVSRENPRKKKATRKAKSSKKKSIARKPRTSSAVSAHAKKSKQYKSLRSAAKKTAFLKAFKTAFAQQNRRSGVTEAQAAARAALIANAKVNSATRKRKNPASATVSTVSRMNPRKKTTRKSSKKKTTRKSSSKKTSMRAGSLEAIAQKSSLYKRLKSAALKKKFVAHFKKVHAKIARKAKSAAQANARAAMSAWGTVSKGNTRKNPSACRTNPRKKSSSRKSSSRKSSSTKRARGQRLKRSMRKSAKQALSVAGIYTYKIEMKGKVHTLKVNKNSKEYKSAKSGGLSKVKMTKLRGKKNTPTSLNLRSVYKVVDGRPTKKDFQRAINAWAGAVDGGKIRGISKRDVARTRMNPASVRRHTVNAISNPMPESMAMRMYRHNERSGMDTAKLVGIGLGSAYGTAIASNFFSSLLHRDFALNVTAQDRADNSSKKILAEALPPALFGVAGGIGLYQKYVKKADVPDAWVAFSGGMVAGAIASVASRTIVKGMAKFIPGFRSVSEYGGDSITLKVEEKKEDTATAQPQNGFLLDLQSKGHNMSKFAQRRNGLGLYTSVPVPVVKGYVADADVESEEADVMGTYLTRSNPADRVYGLGAEDHADRLFGTVRADVVRGLGRANPALPDSGISPIGANTQMVPNKAPVVPDGMFNIDFKGLREDMELIEPLSSDELVAEGLTNIYSSGEQLHIIRATPDVARQIAEANFGNIVGPSRVVNGAVLVLASIFDTPQNPVLTDRLRLGRSPEVPKGASFPQAGGVFSRVAFSSHLPSINNQASFQEFGVRVKQA